MPQSHLKFHSTNGKRLVLVVDDEQINREILGAILGAEYEVLYASDGSEALELMHTHHDTLSLVLLDLLMPVMSGFDVLKAAKADEHISHIPIIVITSEQSAEIESLHLGAVDFIPKPYPDAGVVLARVERTIEFNEDRETIASTERDPLTGLYNKEFFYLYAEQYDQFHRDTEMDAIILDVNNFHMINERYGKAYGDEVLCRIGKKVREIVQDSGGIVCRRESDAFLVYCPHRDDYKEILENASIGLAGDESADNRVRLRMGIYSNVDKENVEMERRFDRAKMAANKVKGSFTNPIGIYDENMHNRELYAEQLIEDFPTAIAKKQFQVYYQPKFDVRPEVPVLASAEALVRWVHPEHNMISPGIFIPLFEENGLIEQLDQYVWRESARQIREWKEKFGFAVPISVNVSRVDLYDPNIFNIFQSILAENGLTTADLMLEVTESAYTQDSDQIIETVSKLRDLGFRIEMDDFGTGYSSLNMISTLPIDVLKLDMQFIRTAFKEGGNTHMLEIIIQIADFLDVPVIAEGVETEDQLHTLRHLGCDLIQGYFFSKPVPAKEFEAFILQKKEAMKNAASRPERLTCSDSTASIIEKPTEKSPTSEKAQEAAYDDLGQESSRPALHLRTANIFFSVLAAIAALALFISGLAVTRGYQRMEQASDRYIASQLAASDMESGSDYLTDRVRCFVVTGELEYLEDFFEEVEVTRRRDNAVANLEKLIGTDNAALANLNTALELSNSLVATEYHAMRLALEAGDYDMSLIPEAITAIELSEAEKALSPEELHDKAQDLVFDNNYMHFKNRIRENVSQCTQALIRASSQELENASAKMSLLVRIQMIVTVVFLLIVAGFVAVIRYQILKPLTNMVEKIKNQEVMQPSGAEELRFVAQSYNDFIQNKFFRDPLTGLNNRRSFDVLMQNVDTDHMAYLVIDVDNFKTINDKYGHAMGDRVLRRVAEVLKNSFRSVDIICRFGGDEFVVVMTRSNSTMQQLVRSKISRANDILLHPKDDLPPVSLSVGVAFADRQNPQNNIFEDADAALYQVKQSGRNGCAFFGE